ncbi:MAG: metallophosphoesterase [Oscillospiraceae bacterium]|nr:metallophosphoesterase [Oscillospiraceae bacterium]
MIYITGDFHGEYEKFRSAEMRKLKKGDTLIICGDFGFLWDGGRAENQIIKKIGKKKYKVLFVEGAHENYKAFDEYPDSEVFGGEGKIIYGNLIMLKRGNIYEIEGKKVLAFGGGIGEYIENTELTEGTISRLPTEEDMERTKANIKAQGDEVDLVVTHDCPMLIRGSIIGNSEDMNHLHIFLQVLSERMCFKRWYFGSYHLDRQISSAYRAVYDDVVKVDI